MILFSENGNIAFAEHHADVAELADAPDLGSGVPDVQVRFLSSALSFKAGSLREILWRNPEDFFTLWKL